MDNKVLEVTAAARQQILHKGVKNVRMGVKEAGCAGMEYIFEEGVETQTDHVLNHGDFNFLIDTSHMPYIEGMKLDYVRDGIQERFEFINPKVAYACGCGTSLTFETDENE
jgi:iron-sulfur cluster assembly protein|tara:strand:+ start:142 stop:474 length:333 start_codon:yes stop_codon:yes gene_type:complete